MNEHALIKADLNHTKCTKDIAKFKIELHRQYRVMVKDSHGFKSQFFDELLYKVKVPGIDAGK